MRDLKPEEHAIISKLLSVSFIGKEAVIEQLNNCQAEATGDTDNYGSIHLRTTSDKPALVKDRIPVEAIAKDADGVPVSVLLHVVNGFVNELEILRADGAPLQAAIHPRNMEVTVN
jgi:hypothetical protein